MFSVQRITGFRGVRVLGFLLIGMSPLAGHAGQDYRIYVSNEKSGDVTVIDGGDNRVLGTIPVGKRPRGIHAGPDGKTVYVALSGTPHRGATPARTRRATPYSKRARTTMTMIASSRINRPTPSAWWMSRK